jgi:hypothetical protein
MPAGPKISSQVHDVIAEEALKNPYLQRGEVIELIKKRLDRQGFLVPAYTTLIKLISEARQVSEDDKPWSFSIDEEIFNGLRGMLIKLQRWCLIIGAPLTIREARWASRLVNALDDEKYLLETAWRYSVRERIKALYQDLDMDLCFPRHSTDNADKKYAASKAGIIHYLTREDLELIEEPSLNFDLKNPTWIERAMHIPLDKAMEIKVLGEPVDHTKELSDSNRELYAIWLRYCAQSSKWDELEYEMKVKLSRQLHMEVAEYGNLGEISIRWEPSPEIFDKLELNQETQ